MIKYGLKNSYCSIGENTTLCYQYERLKKLKYIDYKRSFMGERAGFLTDIICLFKICLYYILQIQVT